MNTIVYGNKILLNNAYEAWYQAIKYARKIKSGLVSLQYRKAFVSNLHNAVELFFKQLMLDQNDYTVATVKNVDKDGEPLRAYYNSDNLNSFFKELAEEKRNKFFSIEFNKIKDKYEDLLKPYYSEGINFSLEELSILQTCRNNETHFYIDQKSFLTNADFIKLNNFMIKFYYILCNCNLIMPYDEKDGLMNELAYCAAVGDNVLKKDSFSYKKALKYSSKAKTIAKIIYGRDVLPQYYNPISITKYFLELFKSENIMFEEALGYIQSFFDFNLIGYKIVNGLIERDIECPDRQYVYCRITIKFKYDQ